MSPSNTDSLPEGWTVVTAADVCEVNPRKPAADALPVDAPVTFVPMAAVDADLGAIVDGEERPFGEVRPKSYTPFAEGDVLLAKITPCMENGKAAVARGLANGLGFGTTEFHVFRSKGGVLPEYLYHYVRQQAFRDDAQAHMAGAVGQLRVPASYVKQFELPLPPLAEQERIVTKVEALLSRVRAVRNRLAAVPGILKHFRQAVLAHACSGKLTEDWRADAIDASGSSDAAALLAEITKQRPRRFRANNAGRAREAIPALEGQTFDAPDEWPIVSLDELVCLVTSGSRGWAKYYSNEGPLFIRAQNINSDWLDLEDAAHVSPPASAEGARTQVEAADLLITITGANVTKSAWVTGDIGEAFVSQHVALVRPVLPDLAPYLYLWVISRKHGRRKLESDAYGAGKPGLNLTQIREMPVAMPPLAEQHEIVRRVEALFALADSIQQRVQTATKQAEALTQSILARAFRGELVPTEADLARDEGRDYESAEQLLARVRAGSVAPRKTAKRRKAQRVSK